MSIFFTSDFHFGHANIIKFCGRPFTSVEQMDITLIKNCQSVVGPEDDLFILGDLTMRDIPKYVNRLPGRKYLIRGNHDKKSKDAYLKNGFSWVKDVYDLKITLKDGSKNSIWLSHYSHQSWKNSFHGSWHLFGHSHGLLPGIGLSTDVGVDCWNYTPVSLTEIESFLQKKKIEIKKMSAFLQKNIEIKKEHRKDL